MFYAVDLHSNNFIVSHRNEKGNIKTKKYWFKDEGLKEFKSILNKDDTIAIESTCNSYYFFDEINPLVKEVKIINPARFKVISESSSKTDKNDTLAILQFLEKEMLPEIKIPCIAIRDLRGIFSTYLILVKQKSAIKNRIHGLLKSNGIIIEKKDFFCKSGQAEIRKQSFCDIENLQIEILLSQIEILEEKIKEIKKEILKYSKEFKEELEILITIPGISIFIGLAILSDIGDINYFKNAKKLCSYLGVIPKVRSSNEKTRTGKITKRGRKLARSFLSQVIFHFINSSKIYKEFYQKKKKEKGSGKAIVAMMRKLIVIIYHMLKKKKLYYYMMEKQYKNKLQEWLKTISDFRKIDKDYLDKWERKIRIKYDINYYQKDINLINSA